jgi:hypothetical protein
LTFERGSLKKLIAKSKRQIEDAKRIGKNGIENLKEIKKNLIGVLGIFLIVLEKWLNIW